MSKKFLSLERLTEYDALIKADIAEGDSSALSSAKTYTNEEIAKITNGSVVVSKATTASDAEKLNGQEASYYAKASDIPTGALANKSIVSESDLDSALAEKVNAASEGNHSHLNKGVLDGITAEKVAAWDSAEQNAKDYADTAAADAAAAIKDDLLNGAGDAYDTLKELGDLIDANQDAIEALETIASGKADAEHTHEIADVTGLQGALDGKAASSHEHVVAHITDLTATATELNYVKGVTSGVQAQLDGKAAVGHGHDAATTSADGFMTAAMVTKLEGIAEGATNVVVDSALSASSTNPVQNKIVNGAISDLTSAISSNTGAISDNTTAIGSLRAEVESWVEVTSQEIQALFA